MHSNTNTEESIMSAPKPLKAMSLRDSLAKTVRLLTKQGVNVQFRGHQPFVETRGDKVVRLVLPEINDNAPPELIAALQGFLDHEVGHIFYTPFNKATRFAKGDPRKAALTNIVEDIRLEKLLPRDLPGTKENLERMYENVMESFFGPPAARAKDPNSSPSEAFSSVMVIAMRALAGQKAFKKYMDDQDLWQYFTTLTTAMPDLSKRLRDLEDFKDVQRLVDDILTHLTPPPPPEKQDDTPDKSEPADTDDGGTEPSGESDDGEGHGDGEGTDDGEGDEDDTGTCKGGPGEDEGDADDGDSEDDTAESNTPADNDLEGNPRERKSSDKGPKDRSLRDALAMLEPTQRRALFLLKRKKQNVSQIAEDINKTEDETVEILAKARKRLRELLNGG
jgi:cobalamin biosynthesis protein CobT